MKKQGERGKQNESREKELEASVKKLEAVSKQLKAQLAPLPEKSAKVPVERILTEYEVKSMLKEKGFFDSGWNNQASGFLNDFVLESKGKVVYDGKSGLRWQQSGSKESMSYKGAKEYVDELNRKRFADYRDWRLPTLEEAMSLMEPTKTNGDLYIDPKFDKEQEWIWTSDVYSASKAWAVGFDRGCNYREYDDPHDNCYVRAVR